MFSETKKSLLSVLLLPLLLSSVLCYDGSELDGSGCPKRFAGRCTCGLASYRQRYNDPVYITNCTNAGFTNADVLEYLPKQTVVLIATGNHFPTLPWNLFGIWDDYPKLEVIDLTNNGIKEIQGKSFHKVASVKLLILNHNDLYIVSSMHHPRVFSNFENLEELHLTNAFTEQIDAKWYLTSLKDIFINSNLKKLRKLHLEQNEIWEISNDDLFCDLPALMDLHLGDNQLTDINFSLRCLRQLRYLDMGFNKITHLQKPSLEIIEEVFGNRSSTSQIDLHGNPYVCDCHLRDFVEWQRTTNTRLVNKEEMRCYTGSPETNAGKRLKNVNQLTCSEGEQAGTAFHSNREVHGSSHAVTNTLLIVLVIFIGFLILLILWTNRTRVASRFNPIVKNLKTSMQYSSIDKQEKADIVPPEVNV